MTSTIPSTEPTGTRWDRLARLVLPPADTLGGRATVATPVMIILIVALATAAATQAWGWRLTSGETGGLPESMHSLIWVAAGLTPVFATLRAGVLALLAWAILVLVGAPARVRPLFSALLYGEALLSLEGPGVLVTLLLQGGTRTHGAPVPTGLDFFVDPAHRALFAAAHGITPFHIAWVLFIAHAVARSCPTSRGRGLAVAGALWLLVVGVGVLRAYLAGGVA